MESPLISSMELFALMVVMAIISSGIKIQRAESEVLSKHLGLLLLETLLRMRACGLFHMGMIIARELRNPKRHNIQ